MTEKELRKLRRQDLLQLLILQGREVSEQADKIRELQDRIAALERDREQQRTRDDRQETELDRLREQLDGRDKALEELREQLKAKESALESLREKLERKNDAVARLAERLGDKVEELQQHPPAHPAPETPLQQLSSHLPNLPLPHFGGKGKK